jgi:excisionase family DNA binding protein
VDDDVETRFYTPTEVRELLKVSRTTVHEWTERGLLRAYKLPSGRRRYPGSQPVIAEALASLGGPR